VPAPAAPEVPLTRLAALVVLTAAFAPAAVLGALPLLLLTMVSGSSMLAAVVLALPQRRPVPATVPVPPPAVDPH
jgi:hypothetical protein